MLSRKSRILILGAFIVFAVLSALPKVLNQENQLINEQVRSEAPGSFIELPHGMVHYKMLGSDTAKTVLLVHGFSVPMYIFDSTFMALSNEGYRVISFDLYGRGYSDRPELDYNKEFFTQHIFDLLQVLDITQTIDIVGLSMGGALVTEFVNAYPDKVDKVILIDPVHGAEDISILKVPLVGEYITNVLVAPSFADAQSKSFYRPERFPHWVNQYKVQMQYVGFKYAIISTLRHYMIYDKLDAYKQMNELNKPVLMFWGKQDATLPYEGNERIRSVLDCEFVSIDSCGHIPNYEYPEIVNPVMIDFLKK